MTILRPKRRRRRPPRPVYSRITDGKGKVVYQGYNRAKANRIWAGMVDDSKVLVARITPQEGG